MAFDVITPVKLGRGAIGVGVSTFYTTPVLTRTMVKDIDVSNTTAAPISVTVYLVESGGTASAANTLVPAALIPANSIFQWSGSQMLNAGDTVQAIATAVGCTINASGAECV